MDTSKDRNIHAVRGQKFLHHLATMSGWMSEHYDDDLIITPPKGPAFMKQDLFPLYLFNHAYDRGAQRLEDHVNELNEQGMQHAHIFHIDYAPFFCRKGPGNRRISPKGNSQQLWHLIDCRDEELAAITPELENTLVYYQPPMRNIPESLRGFQMRPVTEEYLPLLDRMDMLGTSSPDGGDTVPLTSSYRIALDVFTIQDRFKVRYGAQHALLLPLSENSILSYPIGI